MALRKRNAATRDVTSKLRREEFVRDMAPIRALNMKGINSAILVYAVVNVFLEESIVKNTKTLMIIMIKTKRLVS
jgi:hypothetical protein